MKMNTAERKTIDKGQVKGIRPYPIIWSCQHCCNNKPGPDGTILVDDNIGEDEEFILSDDEEIGLCFASHISCEEISRAEWELYMHRDSNGMIH